mmetsp:Transcript_8431/g.21543  ORF Transcript_8431/g.21543 Transcript_8431/m.21543 type:complete len:330 (-) Transcript_8431:560-1549(-)
MAHRARNDPVHRVSLARARLSVGENSGINAVVKRGVEHRKDCHLEDAILGCVFGEDIFKNKSAPFRRPAGPSLLCFCGLVSPSRRVLKEHLLSADAPDRGKGGDAEGPRETAFSRKWRTAANKHFERRVVHAALHGALCRQYVWHGRCQDAARSSRALQESHNPAYAPRVWIVRIGGGAAAQVRHGHHRSGEKVGWPPIGLCTGPLPFLVDKLAVGGVFRREGCELSIRHRHPHVVGVGLMVPPEHPALLGEDLRDRLWPRANRGIGEHMVGAKVPRGQRQGSHEHPSPHALRQTGGPPTGGAHTESLEQPKQQSSIVPPPEISLSGWS